MAVSILSIINFLSFKDRGSRKIAADVPYGAAARQRLDIYAPRQAHEPLPVIMFVYGGSWSDGSRKNYDFVGRALAALGYVVVIPDYRLLPEVEYPVFIDDCTAAFRWTRDNIGDHGGDKRRVALMGHSAGAYNAVMMGLAPELAGQVACIVGLSGPYDFLPFDGPITLRTFGAVSDPERTQPVNLVTAAAPPMFLGTGDKDTLVYPRNTVALAQRLRAAGVPVQERHYPKLGHPGPLMALGRPGRGIAPVLAEVGEYLGAQLD